MKNKKAFTLIELLVVIAIIGVLVTIAVIALQNARSKARDAKRVADIKQVQTALELFFNDKGRYPTNEEFITGSIMASSSVGTTTYMVQIPTASNPPDGSCTGEQNLFVYSGSDDGTTYTVSYCLGNTTGSLPGGPHCATPAGISDGTNCSGSSDTFVLRTAVTNSSQDDYFFSSVNDSNYVYTVGQSIHSLGAAAIIAKYNKSDLLLNTLKVYDGPSDDNFNSIAQDTASNYLYAVGTTYSENAQDGAALIVRYNKNDLSTNLAQIYDGSLGGEAFNDVAVYGNYIYAVGVTYSENNQDGAALLVRYNKSDLSIDQVKVYDTDGAKDVFNDVLIDGNYVYAVGGYALSDNNPNPAGAALIVRYNLSDLHYDTAKIFDSNSDEEQYYALVADNDYLYAAGETLSDATVGGGLVVKYNKSDLSVTTSRVYDGSDYDSFNDIAIDGSYLYVGFETLSEATAGALLVKCSKDLAVISQKVFYDNGFENFYGLDLDSNYIYATGDTGLVDNTYGSALLTKTKKAIPSGSFTTTPTGYIYDDSNLSVFIPMTISAQDVGMIYDYSPVNLSASTPVNCQDLVPVAQIDHTYYNIE